MRTKPVLIIDSREKNAWDFDDDDAFEAVEITKLKYGDYAIKGLESVCVIEKKASCDELLNNFISNKQRIFKEMVRMQECQFRFIVIEENLEDIMHPKSYYYNTSGKNKSSQKMPVGVVISNLIEIMLSYNVQVIFAGNQAQFIARKILLRAYQLHKGKKL